MVFELDTKDMERHAVELRLFMDKARRRFDKAQLADQYEKIVKNALAQSESEMTEQNSLKIDNVNSDSAQRLVSFLDNLVTKCQLPEQHEALQNALRSSLHQARRKSVLDGSNGCLAEQVCYFCAGSPPEVDPHKTLETALNLHNVFNQMTTLQRQVTPPPSSIEGPSPPLNENDEAPAAAAATSFQGNYQATSTVEPSQADEQVAVDNDDIDEPVAAESSRKDTPQAKRVVFETSSTSDSNASNHLEIVLEELDNQEGNQNKEQENEEVSMNGAGGVTLDGRVIPPTPEEDEQLGEAHEDSMHEWFETLNQTAVQRASTPVSSKINDNVPEQKKFSSKRFSDIKFSIAQDNELSNKKNNDIFKSINHNLANHSLNSTNEGQTSLYSQHIQSSVDNSQSVSSNLQTSATQPARSEALIVKHKPKIRSRGQTSKHLSTPRSSPYEDRAKQEKAAAIEERLRERIRGVGRPRRARFI